MKPYQELTDLSLEAALLLVSDPNSTKAKLQELAIRRFDVPKGQAMRYSRKALADRLETLIMNERTHEIIARLASRK